MASRATSMPPPCIAAIPAGAPAGETARPDLLPGVDVTVVKHLHSAVSPNDGVHVPVLPPPSLTSVQKPPTPEDLQHLVGHLPDAEGGTLLYRFEVGGFTMVWNDSAGPLTDEAPGVFDTLRALRPVDLQVGAIQGFNQVSNGLRDPVEYLAAIGARTFIPTHHDDWAAGITTRGEHYRAPFYAELERVPADQRPEVRFITDPGDYLRPMAFPAPLRALRLTTRCRRGKARPRLRGDRADVVGVTYRRRGRRVHARVVLRDGTVVRLVARARRCR
jgi:hypothetical protein